MTNGIQAMKAGAHAFASRTRCGGKCPECNTTALGFRSLSQSPKTMSLTPPLRDYSLGVGRSFSTSVEHQSTKMNKVHTEQYFAVYEQGPPSKNAEFNPVHFLAASSLCLATLSPFSIFSEEHAKHLEKKFEEINDSEKQSLLLSH